MWQTLCTNKPMAVGCTLLNSLLLCPTRRRCCRSRTSLGVLLTAVHRQHLVKFQVAWVGKAIVTIHGIETGIHGHIVHAETGDAAPAFPSFSRTGTFCKFSQPSPWLATAVLLACRAIQWNPPTISFLPSGCVDVRCTMFALLTSSYSSKSPCCAWLALRRCKDI